MIPNGLHHITCVTVDARACVDFYTRLLGLKLVKRTVNQDVPDVWHLFFGDDNGSPGMDLTFFEFRGLPLGVQGHGAAHTVRWRVASQEALDFWERRLAENDVAADRGTTLRFADHEGLGHELIIDPTGEAPLRATSTDIPEEFALLGFDGVRVHSVDPDRSADLLRQILGFEGDAGPVASGTGPSRSGGVIFDEAPDTRHQQGAGSVHHIAWCAYGGIGELEDWRLRIANLGLRPTPVIDRFWFNSVYFRGPDGLLHEFATPEPGFTVDEPLETLGTKLVLPPKFEPQRAEIERRLTKID